MGDDSSSEWVANPTHLFTYDHERLEHIISDETLMQLAHGGRDTSLEVAICALGVAGMKAPCPWR